MRSDAELRERLFESRELVVVRELASTLLPEPGQERIKAGSGGRRPGAGARRGARTSCRSTRSSPEEIEFLRARTRVRIDKARRVLGYRPAWDLEAGMEMTGRWARWAELVP